MNTTPKNARAIQSSQAPKNLRPLGALEQRASLLGYAWHSRKTQFLVVGFAVMALILAVVFLPQLRPPATVLPVANDWLNWQSNLQSLFGLATMLIAAFVWLDELKEDWRSDLPCLLSVYFFHRGEPALVCYHAYLAGESEIRAWGQQIARQMVRGDLQFRPIVDTRPIDLLTDGTTIYLHHQARFSLTELPGALAGRQSGGSGGSLCLVWHPRLEETPPQPASAIPATRALGLPDVRIWITTD